MTAAVAHSWDAKDLVPSVMGCEEQCFFTMYDVLNPPMECEPLAEVGKPIIDDNNEKHEMRLHKLLPIIPGPFCQDPQSNIQSHERAPRDRPKPLENTNALYAEKGQLI